MKLRVQAEPDPITAGDGDPAACYFDTLALIERMHRLLLDLVKDEFHRLGILDINPVQARLLFLLGDDEITVGEIRGRGYYHGTNVSYSVKKLVGSGYMLQEVGRHDRREIRVRVTGKGRRIQGIVGDVFRRHAAVLDGGVLPGDTNISDLNRSLRALEEFWAPQVRHPG